jgi:hypothetical protein
MIFDQPRQPVELQDRSAQRLACIAKLIAIFETSFSSVRYRVLESISTVNAQASVSNGESRVDLFGGLAFHPMVRHDGLVFTLLHETGHHLGAGCRLPWAQLACECAADSWATTDGRKALRASGAKFRLETALRQIECAAGPKQQRILSRRAARTNCWSMNWRERKQILLDGRAVNFQTCQISSAIGR